MTRPIIVDAEAFDAFIELLDREPQFNPRLAELLARPTVLDQEAST